MGTSSSYGGGTGSNPLLPPWADPSEDFDGDTNDNSDDQNGADGDGKDEGACEPSNAPRGPVAWSSTKGGTTRWINGKGESGGRQRVASHYVRSQGGARQAMGFASSSRAASRNFGRFLADATGLGLSEAARQGRLPNLLGRDLNSALAALVDFLAPDGALREENAARQAIIETINELSQMLDLEANGIIALEALDEATAREATLLMISNAINEGFQQALMISFERGDVTESRANALTESMREYIRSSVRADFGSVNVLQMNWQTQGKALTDRIFYDAYSFLENEGQA